MLKPETDDELWDVVKAYVGLEIPRTRVCDSHCAPFTAFADAYFAKSPVTVWKASRGFGGKSIMLAALSFVEAITLGAWVNLLGGSGEQSIRVLQYMQGDHPNVPGKFWGHSGAPIDLVKGRMVKQETALSNLGRIKTLMASQTSVRGPHPQRLRLDEVDELTIELLDSALGQPMGVRGIQDQTVMSSTHQYADGTMTEVLKRASLNSWPIYEWCWKENLEDVDFGWLTNLAVQRKKQTVTVQMWENEYDLQAPNPQSRAIDNNAVLRTFRRRLGVFEGALGEYIEIEGPVEGATYSHGADWAKRVDHTIISTFRTDISPMRLVAFERRQKEPWPMMIGRFNKRVERYGGTSSHDRTGIGDVIDDYITVDAEGVVFTGTARQNLLSGYILGIEEGEIEAPWIQSVVDEHQCSVDDMFGNGHLPDSISSMSLAYKATQNPSAFL